MDSNPTQISSVVVTAGGDPWSGPLPRIPSSVSQVIAADSGVELALQLGLPVSVVIGDLDSASPAALAEAELGGARIERHSKDKDATDLELALDLAVSEGATTVVVIGGSGGRLSHLLGNATLLASSKYAAITISWLLPGAEVHVIRPGVPISVHGDPGDLISLIPVGGDGTGVNTTGLRWQLRNDTLRTAATRGISNEMVAWIAELSLTHGTLLAVHERPSS